MNKRITSTENKDIKKIIKLANKPRLRKESKSFVVEGKRELEMAFSNGYFIKKIYCNPNIVDPKAIKSKYDSQIIEVNNDIYSKISFRSSTEGVVGIVFQKDKNLKLDDGKNNLAIVLDGIEKPGNIGAILRSCDSADVDLIILNNEKCDLYNPNLIRSSLGSIFSLNVVSMESDDTLDFLREHKFKIYATASLAWILFIGYLTWWNGLRSPMLDKSFRWDEWFWFGIVPAICPYLFYFIWKKKE